MTNEVTAYWAKVSIGNPDDCWPWSLTKQKDGYAITRWEGRKVMAHRVAYFLTHHEWPKVTLHSCDVRSCCNPRHLRSGTHMENTHDCISKGRFPLGVKSGMAKINNDIVKELRSRQGYWGCQTAWAKEFGIHQTTVSDILSHKIWKHVIS